MAVKINLTIITKNHAADQELGFLQNRFQSPMTAQKPCRQRGSLKTTIERTIIFVSRYWNYKAN